MQENKSGNVSSKIPSSTQLIFDYGSRYKYQCSFVIAWEPSRKLEFLELAERRSETPKHSNALSGSLIRRFLVRGRSDGWPEIETFF